MQNISMAKHIVTDEKSSFKAAFILFSLISPTFKGQDRGSNSTSIDVDHFGEKNEKAFHGVVTDVIA